VAADGTTPRDAARERFRRIRAATLAGSAAAFAVLVGAAAATGLGGGDDGRGSQADAGAVAEQAQDRAPATDDGGDFWDAVRSEAQEALGDAVDGRGVYFGDGDEGDPAPSSSSGAS
jgi:hypothetical protein